MMTVGVATAASPSVFTHHHAYNITLHRKGALLPQGTTPRQRCHPAPRPCAARRDDSGGHPHPPSDPEQRLWPLLHWLWQKC